jgi:hypothetical protein
VNRIDSIAYRPILKLCLVPCIIASMSSIVSVLERNVLRSNNSETMRMARAYKEGFDMASTMDNREQMDKFFKLYVGCLESIGTDKTCQEDQQCGGSGGATTTSTSTDPVLAPNVGNTECTGESKSPGSKTAIVSGNSGQSDEDDDDDVHSSSENDEVSNDDAEGESLLEAFAPTPVAALTDDRRSTSNDAIDKDIDTRIGTHEEDAEKLYSGGGAVHARSFDDCMPTATTQSNSITASCIPRDDRNDWDPIRQKRVTPGSQSGEPVARSTRNHKRKGNDFPDKTLGTVRRIRGKTTRQK